MDVISVASVPSAPPMRVSWRQELLGLTGLIALPLTVYYLWSCVTFHDGALAVPTSWQELGEWLARLPAPTWPAAGIIAAWVFLQVVLQIWAPGRVTTGPPLADGSRLTYRTNGWFAFCFTLALVSALAWVEWLPATVAYDHFGALLTVTNLVAFGFGLFLYAYGRSCDPASETTRGFFYNYWMGTGLNPRVKGFDFKFFCECRPGLIAWVLINLSFAAKQLQLHGVVTTPMLLVCAFHLFYVADCFWHEEAVLTTWDIKYERFGWMLCWGDLVWVPFTYTLQAAYLVQHPHQLPWWGTVGIIVLNVTGYYLFRSSNWQKHRFRKDPTSSIWGKAPTYIPTAIGTNLLTSGWWGVARHVNYLGDLLMGLAWCLPCLFGSILPYFYIIYFLILLIHRERRDNAQCLSKYGPAWEQYCAQVPYRIVPGVY